VSGQPSVLTHSGQFTCTGISDNWNQDYY